MKIISKLTPKIVELQYKNWVNGNIEARKIFEILEKYNYIDYCKQSYRYTFTTFLQSLSQDQLKSLSLTSKLNL